MNTERIKERNEIAKAIYLKNTILTESVAYNSVQAANEMMAQMYGKDWAGETDEQPSQPAPSGDTAPIVSIAEQDGEKGVRLCIADVDIFIEAKDLDDSRGFEWDEAMARLKELNKRTFSKHESYFLAAFEDKINEKLREIGGEELDGRYWSSTESNSYYSGYAWIVNFSYGTIANLSKYYSLVVRPCAAFVKP